VSNCPTLSAYRSGFVANLFISGGLRRLVKVPRFDLVIFDCDGVLVDSERLAVRTEAEILSGLGWPLTETEIVERFVGRTAAYMHQEIERHLGRSVDWDAEFEPRYQEVFERELVPVPGVIEALDQITTPMCVASSGSHEKMRFTLGKTGLLDHFAGRIFSVDQVEHGKPAPDIFLFAADQMDTTPERCAVVEDSVSGVTAGLAAGMAVFAFAGGVTTADLLSIEGVAVFDDMTRLPALLRAP
jgi:HAD superfamily hydrolase (TIGR01509 family)